MIQFDRVTRNYGKKAAVRELTLDVLPGQLFAFLGPNGAGKTTTIKMVVGLLRPSSGTIRLCGQDVTENHSAANRLLGYVPDVPYLYDKLSGQEFLDFIAQMYSMPSRHAHQRIRELIDAFQLGDFIDDLTESYSHGMKQRLAFAAALLHEPKVLVIDEPMVGLDPASVRLVKDLLRAQAAAGQTIFMSTHLLSIAEEIADRVGILDAGRLKFLGTLDELQRQMAVDGATLEELYLRFMGEETQGPKPARSPEAPAAALEAGGGQS